MPTFSYKAKDKKGGIVEGSLEADARQAVVTRLQQMGYFPISITAGGGGGGRVATVAPAPPPASAGPSRSVSKPSKSELARPSKADLQKPSRADVQKPGADSAKPAEGGWFVRKNVTSAEIASFNRQLADLIGSGVPLVRALGILFRQGLSPALREIVQQILDDVQAGATFADSLGRHPKVFSKLFVAMVRSGEAGGMLDAVLQRLADMSEQEEQLKGKVKSALAYPVVMILAGSVAVGVMFGFVVPKITQTFEKLGQTLPLITQVLIAFSKAFESYWYIALALIIFVVAAGLNYLKTTDGRAAWDRLALRLPLIGDLVRKREVARFSRTLGSLLKNGVSILSALEIVRDVVDNTVFRAEIDNIVDEITQGESVAKPLRQSVIVPPVAVNMIAIGEETGRLPDVLLRVSETFETQVERTVRTMTSLLEPLIICGMGLVVGFIVIAMLLPIFSLDPTGGK